MGLESGTYIGDLVAANPVGATDPKSQGDNHLQLIKSTLQATFPGMAGCAWRFQTKASTYTVVANDNMSILNCTAGLTLDYTACATLGNGHVSVVYANGGAVIIDPNASELVNGLGTWTVPIGSVALVMCTGSALVARELFYEGRGSVAMHATTMNLWAQPNIIDGTSAAATVTAIVNAPQAGARRVLYPVAASVITNGATFAVDGAANHTAAAGDRWEFEAITTSTYKVHVTKKDGTPLILGAITPTTVTPSGLVDISGAGAGQIKFPATQNASSNANTLDDYEEGTWTPTDASGAGLSITVTSATYIKIGQLVHVQMDITYPSTADGTGASTGGLLFTNQNTNGPGGAPCCHNTSANDLMGMIQASAITIYWSYNNGAPAANSSFSTKFIRWGASYRASA